MRHFSPLTIFFIFFYFLAHAINQPLQKANMMYLIKEATNKDQTSKMKMLLSLDNNKKAPTEKIWTKNSF